MSTSELHTLACIKGEKQFKNPPVHCLQRSPLLAGSCWGLLQAGRARHCLSPPRFGALLGKPQGDLEHPRGAESDLLLLLQQRLLEQEEKLWRRISLWSSRRRSSGAGGEALEQQEKGSYEGSASCVLSRHTQISNAPWCAGKVLNKAFS